MALDNREPEEPFPLRPETAPTLDGAPPPARETATPAPPVTLSHSRGPADPARVGRYVILRRLGQGGMGVVFLAYDPDLDRRVALKLVHDSATGPAQGADPSPGAGWGRARVKQEAQALAQVSHPNIVQIYEVGESGGQVFLAMEYVSGDSLTTWQSPSAAPPPPVARILRVYLQAAAGLLAAHRAGLIHRDFKPDNVLLGEDGRARVLDFGLARARHGRSLAVAAPPGPAGRAESGARLTQVGAILGTPGYMSPEQVHGAEADTRSDQFSFCAALYEALYKQLPFAGETFEEFAVEVRAGRLRPPPPGDVPLLVAQALQRGLSIDPAARYPDLQDLILAIEAGLRPDSESPATQKAGRRFVLLAGFLSAAVTGISVLRGLGQADQSLLHGLAAVIVFESGLLGSAFALRRTLLRRASARRIVLFALVVLSYIIAGRLGGHALGLTANRYLPLEMFGIAAMLVVEALNGIPRYGGLAVVSCTSGLLLIRWPQLRALLVSLHFILLAIGSIYFRLQPRAEPSDADA